MSKDSGVYLAAIHDCIRRIRLYTEDGKDAYFADTRTQDAVMRNIYVLGQAIKDFGIDELAARDPSIPWQQVAGMRNMLAHRYLGVDIDVTWDVVENHLEPLRVAIEGVARQLGVRIPAFVKPEE